MDCTYIQSIPIDLTEWHSEHILCNYGSLIQHNLTSCNQSEQSSQGNANSLRYDNHA